MNKLGLRGEILIAFALVTLFAIGLNTIVVLQLDGLLLARERARESETVARLAASSLRDGADAASLHALRLRIPGVLAAQVIDASGEMVLEEGAAPSNAAPPDVNRARMLGETHATPVGLLLGGGQLVSLVTPLGDARRPGPALVLWREVGSGDAGTRRSRRLTILYVALDALIAGSFGWYLIARSVVGPLRRLADATREVTGGNLAVRVPPAGRNELGDLARDFNAMTASLGEKESALARQVVELKKANESLRSAREEVVQSEKLASVGRLAAGVAHELGNPIGAVMGYVSTMLRGPGKNPEEDAEMLRRIDREMKRVDRIIRDLLDFARPRSEDASTFDVEGAVDAALAIVGVQRSFAAVEVERIRGASGTVRGDAHRLQQVVVNLLINAADAVEASKTRRITVETFAAEFPAAPARRRDDPPVPAGPAIGLRVSDTGTGIAPQQMPMLFDPFFTTKEPGRGTGLGLAISRTIVESMGGRIAVESTPGQGAAFTVLLPSLGHPPEAPNAASG